MMNKEPMEVQLLFLYWLFLYLKHFDIEIRLKLSKIILIIGIEEESMTTDETFFSLQIPFSLIEVEAAEKCREQSIIFPL
jgi:hypothetical protein